MMHAIESHIVINQRPSFEETMAAGGVETANIA